MVKNIKENEDLSKLNHSCAHLMAQAVKHLYPEAKFWVGPVVEEGFYYDMDLGDKVITEEDIEKITKYFKITLFRLFFIFHILITNSSYCYNVVSIFS